MSNRSSAPPNGRPGLSFRPWMKLHTGNEFKHVLDNGKRVAVGGVVLATAPRRIVADAAVSSPAPPALPTRLGLTVSRRVGNAVVRNRVKRALRETFRLVWHDLASGHDLVVIARQSAAGADTAQLAQDFCRCVKRLDLWRAGVCPRVPFSSPTDGSASGSSPSS